MKSLRSILHCLRLKERCSSWQLALLETQAPYQGLQPLHVEDVTEEEEVEEPTPELAPLPEDLGPFMDSSVARWPARPVRKEVRPKQLLPMLLLVVRGGTAKGIRHALALVEAQALEICCIRWGPLSLQGMSEPGSLRALSEEEIEAFSARKKRGVEQVELRRIVTSLSQGVFRCKACEASVAC